MMVSVMMMVIFHRARSSSLASLVRPRFARPVSLLFPGSDLGVGYSDLVGGAVGELSLLVRSVVCDDVCRKARACKDALDDACNKGAAVEVRHVARDRDVLVDQRLSVENVVLFCVVRGVLREPVGWLAKQHPKDRSLNQ